MKLRVIRFGCWIIATALLSACVSTNNTDYDGADVVVGAQSPDFSLQALDGSALKNRSMEGNVVLLNFWATWCEPCLREIPELKEVAARSKVKVVGIALDEQGASVVKPFVAQHGINYPVLIGNEEVFQRFNGSDIPYSLLLDRKQRIVKVYRGTITKEEIDQDLRSMGEET